MFGPCAESTLPGLYFGGKKTHFEPNLALSGEIFAPGGKKKIQFWIVQGTILGYSGLIFGSKWVSIPPKYSPGNVEGPNMVIEPIPEELDT